MNELTGLKEEKCIYAGARLYGYLPSFRSLRRVIPVISLNFG